MAKNISQYISRRTLVIIGGAVALLIVVIAALYGLAYHQTNSFNQNAAAAHKALSELTHNSSSDEINEAINSVPRVNTIPLVWGYHDYNLARTQSAVLSYYAGLIEDAHELREAEEFIEVLKTDFNDYVGDVVFETRTEHLKKIADLGPDDVDETKKLSVEYADILIKETDHIRDVIANTEGPKVFESPRKFTLDHLDAANKSYEKFRSAHENITNSPELFIAQNGTLYEALRMSLHTDAMYLYMRGMQGLMWLDITPGYIANANPLEITSTDTNRELAIRKLDYQAFVIDLTIPNKDSEQFAESTYINQYYITQLKQTIDNPSTPSDLADRATPYTDMFLQNNQALHQPALSSNMNNIFNVPGHMLIEWYFKTMTRYASLSSEEKDTYREQFLALSNQIFDDLPDKSPYFKDTVAEITSIGRACTDFVLSNPNPEETEDAIKCINIIPLQDKFRVLRRDYEKLRQSYRDTIADMRQELAKIH